MKIRKKKSLLQRLLKMPQNTRLKPYTTRMAKIQDPNEGKKKSPCYEKKVIIFEKRRKKKKQMCNKLIKQKLGHHRSKTRVRSNKESHRNESEAPSSISL